MENVIDFWKYVICNPDKNSRTISDKSKPIVAQPTSIDELSKIVKYANKHSYKITTISGGHSYYFTREFPKMEYDKLIVVNMSKFNKITQIRKNMIRIEPGVIVKDIKDFNKTIKGYHCIHGDCNGVGFGFWINGIGGFSGASLESLQHGFGSDYIRKIKYIDAGGRCKTVSNNKKTDTFNALKIIGGEFGIIMSIDVELIQADSPKYEYFIVDNSKEEIVEFIQRSYIVEYDGNITVSTINHMGYTVYVIIVVHNVNESNYATNLIKNIFRLNIRKISAIFDFLANLNNNDLSLGYLILFQNSWSESDNLVTDVSDKMLNECIDQFYCCFFLIQNQKCHKQKRMYIGVFEKDYRAQPQNVIDSYFPDRIKYLNVPQPGLHVKDYISPLSKLSYEQLKELKSNTDPNYMFVTTFNAFT